MAGKVVDRDRRGKVGTLGGTVRAMIVSSSRAKDLLERAAHPAGEEPGLEVDAGTATTAEVPHNLAPKLVDKSRCGAIVQA